MFNFARFLAAFQFLFVALLLLIELREFLSATITPGTVVDNYQLPTTNYYKTWWLSYQHQECTAINIIMTSIINWQDFVKFSWVGEMFYDKCSFQKYKGLRLQVQRKRCFSLFSCLCVWWINEAPRNQGGAVFSCLEQQDTRKLLKLKTKLVDKM